MAYCPWLEVRGVLCGRRACLDCGPTWAADKALQARLTVEAVGVTALEVAEVGTDRAWRATSARIRYGGHGALVAPLPGRGRLVIGSGGLRVKPWPVPVALERWRSTLVAMTLSAAESYRDRSVTAVGAWAAPWALAWPEAIGRGELVR